MPRNCKCARDLCCTWLGLRLVKDLEHAAIRRGWLSSREPSCCAFKETGHQEIGGKMGLVTYEIASSGKPPRTVHSFSPCNQLAVHLGQGDVAGPGATRLTLAVGLGPGAPPSHRSVYICCSAECQMLRHPVTDRTGWSVMERPTLFQCEAAAIWYDTAVQLPGEEHRTALTIPHLKQVQVSREDGSSEG